MSCVADAARVLVAGALGLRRRARRAADRPPPGASSWPAITSRSDAGRPLSELYPHHRVDAVLEELDLERHGDVDAAIVAYPHGAAAPVVAALRERGVRVVDLSRRLSPARPRRPTSTGTASTARPSSSAAASTACPSSTPTQLAGADLVANPGCYPTATLLALAPLARAGTIADVVVDAKSGVSGAGRGADAATTHFVDRRRERRRPTASARHRHMPEIDQELALLGAPVTATVHAAPAAARPGRARLLLRHDDDALEPGRASTRPTSAWADAHAVRRARRARRPACATCATRTSARSARARRRAHRQGLRLRGDRQPLEGRRVAGDPEPQPHVRPRRDAGDRAVTARPGVLRLALGARARRTSTRRTPAAGCRPAFAPPAPPRASSRPACSTSACSSATRADAVSAARFTRSGVLAAPVLVTRDETHAPTRCAPSSRTPATRTPRPARPGMEVARAMQRAAADARRRRARPRSPSPRPASSACRCDGRRVADGHRAAAARAARRRRRRRSTRRS